MLLSELYRKFPLPMPGSHHQAQNQSQNSQPTVTKTEEKQDVTIKQEPEFDSQNGGTENGISNQEQNIEIKSEMKPPPEKKMKM